MQRAGHQSFSTTMLYVREAENLGAHFGTPFPPLPAELLGGDSSPESYEPPPESSNGADSLLIPVELTRIELVTSCMPCKRSPN
jgi:hypothetical protein